MAGAIEVLDVVKTYQLGDETFHALDHVTLTIDRGEFVAITGPSGSGKSTLANIIGGLDRPDAGDVVVEGESLARMSDARLSQFRNRQIGFVFQSFNLKADSTALENVMLPLIFGRVRPRQRQAIARECLARVGLEDRMQHRPSQLSGGQRQRVAIARALASSPGVLIADEPTGNLDSARGQEVVEILGALNRDGITLLVITHDQNVASSAHRMIEVRDGKVDAGQVNAGTLVV